MSITGIESILPIVPFPNAIQALSFSQIQLGKDLGTMDPIIQYRNQRQRVFVLHSDFVQISVVYARPFFFSTNKKPTLAG